jgi:hypothetical protein
MRTRESKGMNGKKGECVMEINVKINENLHILDKNKKKKTEIVETSRSRFFFFDETFPAN